MQITNVKLIIVSNLQTNFQLQTKSMSMNEKNTNLNAFTNYFYKSNTTNCKSNFNKTLQIITKHYKLIKINYIIKN